MAEHRASRSRRRAGLGWWGRGWTVTAAAAARGGDEERWPPAAAPVPATGPTALPEPAPDAADRPPQTPPSPPPPPSAPGAPAGSTPVPPTLPTKLPSGVLRRGRAGEQPTDQAATGPDRVGAEEQRKAHDLAETGPDRGGAQGQRKAHDQAVAGPGRGGGEDRRNDQAEDPAKAEDRGSDAAGQLGLAERGRGDLADREQPGRADWGSGPAAPATTQPMWAARAGEAGVSRPAWADQLAAERAAWRAAAAATADPRWARPGSATAVDAGGDGVGRAMPAGDAGSTAASGQRGRRASRVVPSGGYRWYWEHKPGLAQGRPDLADGPAAGAPLLAARRRRVAVLAAASAAVAALLTISASTMTWATVRAFGYLEFSVEGTDPDQHGRLTMALGVLMGLAAVGFAVRPRGRGSRLLAGAAGVVTVLVALIDIGYFRGNGLLSGTGVQGTTMIGHGLWLVLAGGLLALTAAALAGPDDDRLGSPRSRGDGRPRDGRPRWRRSRRRASAPATPDPSATAVADEPAPAPADRDTPTT